MMQYPYPAPRPVYPAPPAAPRRKGISTPVLIAAAVVVFASLVMSAGLVAFVLLASVPRTATVAAAEVPISLPVATETPTFYTTVIEPTAAPPVPTTTHIVEAGQELALIARLYNVDMAEIVSLNQLANPDLLSVGQELLIPAASIYQPDPSEAPVPSATTGKAIVVSVSQQRIYAYENGQMIRSHLVSTGRQVTPTVLGDYRVYVKYLADDMAGPGYFQPQVPYTMYFYRGYAIHGAYWHNSFGRPMSHGCVNLPVDEAGWFYTWAEVGTPVRVIA